MASTKIEEILENKKLSPEQVRIIKSAIDNNIDEAYLVMFATPDFQPQSMFILSKLASTFDIETFGYLANRYLTTRKLQYISDYMIEHELGIEYVKCITNSRLSMSQISLILRELRKGIDIELFEKVCDPALSVSQIAKLLSKR